MEPDVTLERPPGNVFHSHILWWWRSLGSTTHVGAGWPIWGVAPAPDSVQLTLFPLKSSLSSSVTILLFECRHSEVLLLTCFFTKNCTTDEI